MATEDQVNKIQARIENVLATPIGDLVSNPKWGEIDFAQARSNFKTVLDIASHLQHLPIELLPDPAANNILGALSSANTVLESIRNFSVAHGSAVQNRDQYVSEMRQASENLLIQTGSWIPFLAYQRGDVQKNITALNEAVGNANQLYKDAIGSVQIQRNKIDEIINAAREASASAGVAVFTSNFSEQEKIFNEEAIRWLWATAISAALTIITAIGSFFIPIKADATNAQILQFLTSKVVLLVTLITATVWCGRIYKASRHQASTCNHRANSLKTFQAFAKAASDEATKNAVLLESTRSIFAMSPSGYLESSDAATDTGTKILEIVKATGKSSS